MRSLLELGDEFPPVVFGQVPCPAKLRREDGQGSDHVGERFGGRHGLFRPGVNVDALATKAGDGGTHHVDNTEDLATFELDFFDR